MASNQADDLRVLHVLWDLSISTGGPAIVVRSLLPELLSSGVRCALATTTASGDTNVPGEENDRSPLPDIPVHRFATGAARRHWKGHSPALSAFLDSQLRDGRFDLVHVHEIWLYTNYAACRAAHRHGVPHIVTVHGEMDGPRLRKKRIRKWTYMRWVQSGLLRSADAVHALNSREAEGIRRIVKDARVFVLPFGVDCGVANDRSGLPGLYRRYPVLRGAKVVLFLGRLDRIKGPDVLARGFVRACRRHPDAVLLFAGPDYGAKAHVENVVRRAGLSNRVVFAGTIDGPTKAAALAAANVFALPSYSEGFSSSVLEALAAGVPVVISEPCAFPRVEEEAAGLVVPIEERSVASAIDRLLSDRDLREAMGKKGKALAREYSWPGLAARMADRYRAVVEQRRMAGKSTSGA